MPDLVIELSPKKVVRRLQNLGRELQGLNEDNADEALRYAAERLKAELALVLLVCSQKEDNHDADPH